MSPDLTSALTSVLPILLLIGLGMLLRRTPLLDDTLVDGLKRLIIAVALPAVLFKAFLAMRFQLQYLAIFFLVPAVCLALLGLGYLARRITRRSDYLPFLFTGFELGMIGFALFAAVYGLDELPVLGVFALGHELFIWFVFATLLRVQASGSFSLPATLRTFATSPVIIAIALGLALNVLGLAEPMTANPLTASLLRTLDHLGGLIVPLILIIVGFGSRLTLAGVREALPMVAARFAAVLVLALTLNAVVIRGMLGLPPIFEAALFTLLILPPPFIVPLYIPGDRRADLAYTNNVLSLYTVVSVAAFVGYVALG